MYHTLYQYRVHVSARESMILLWDREISEYLIGESTHLLQNSEIFDIIIGFLVSSRCCKITKYTKISSMLLVGALVLVGPRWWRKARGSRWFDHKEIVEQVCTMRT